MEPLPLKEFLTIMSVNMSKRELNTGCVYRALFKTIVS